MNNPNKTTRVFYTYKSADGLKLPACLETTLSWDEAEAELGRQMICQGAPIVSIVRPFASRAEVESRLGDYRERLERLPDLHALANVRDAFARVVGCLRLELESLPA